MSQLLAIAGPVELDGRLIDDVADHRPDAVTVLIEDSEPGDRWAWAQTAEGGAGRDRLARLLGAVEAATGAAVVGLIGPADELAERFDTVVGVGLPVAA